MRTFFHLPDMRTPAFSSRAALSLLLAALVSGLFSLSGCTNASLALYPEFPARKASIQTSMLLADYVILDATMGDTNIVDIAGNKTMAVALMDKVSDLLNEKSYRIENRLLSSMGLLMNQATTAKVMHTFADQELDEDRLALKHPPFYLYRVFEKDTLKELLASFYSSLINSVKLEGQKNPVIREAVPLGKTIGGGTWFVLLTGGYNVPVGRELGVSIPSGSTTLGAVGTHQITQVTMMLFVVDTETGELLWSDQRHEVGGTVHRDRIMRIADTIMNFLP